MPSSLADIRIVRIASQGLNIALSPLHIHVDGMLQLLNVMLREHILLRILFPHLAQFGVPEALLLANLATLASRLDCAASNCDISAVVCFNATAFSSRRFWASAICQFEAQDLCSQVLFFVGWHPAG